MYCRRNGVFERLRQQRLAGGRENKHTIPRWSTKKLTTIVPPAEVVVFPSVARNYSIVGPLRRTQDRNTAADIMRYVVEDEESTQGSPFSSYGEERSPCPPQETT